MTELRCKVCDSTLILRNSKAGVRFLACPKSYKGNNHGTYSEGEYFYVEDRVEEGEGKYYWLPPIPRPRPISYGGNTPRQAPSNWRGVSSVWEDHVRQFSEDRDHGLASISGTEYDLGMSYWEGHY